MKRLFPVLVCCLPCVAGAQVTPTAQANAAPAYEPQDVNVKSDGRCMTVRPGDTVHYTLTIEGVTGVHPVYGDLRLRLGRTHELSNGGLPVPDFRSLGGGGLGTHDAGEGKVFHFTFKVPREIYGGAYRGVEVNVRADQPQPTVYRPSYGLTGERESREYAAKVEVTRHTRDEVHAYCLNVMSNFGLENRNRPAVTDFQPGQIDPPAATPVAPQPVPLSAQPSPVPSQPLPLPPQPR